MKKLIEFLKWVLSMLLQQKTAVPPEMETRTGVQTVVATTVPEAEAEELEELPSVTTAFSRGDRFLAEGIQRKCRHPSLRTWGCYFFLLYRWAQELNHSLGPRDYLYWYDVCVAAGHVIDDPARNKRAFIRNAAGVMNVLVGTRLFSIVRHVPTMPEGMRMFPVRVQNGDTAHFVLQTESGEAWDSLGGGPYPTVDYREIV